MFFLLPPSKHSSPTPFQRQNKTNKAVRYGNIFIFSSHYYRSKARKAARRARQGGARAVDLPARSFDLAHPGVAPPLVSCIWRIGLLKSILHTTGHTWPFRLTGVICANRTYRMASGVGHWHRQCRGGDATINRHYFSTTLFSVTRGHCRRRTSCVTVTAICYACDLSRTEFFLAVYSVHQ